MRLLHRIPVDARVHVLTFVLIVVACAAGWAAGLLEHSPTVTRTRLLTPSAAVARMTAPELAAALGKPTSTQHESNGVVCSFWQTRTLELCWKP